MSSIQVLLLLTTSIAVLGWVGISLHVLYVQRQRVDTERVLSSVAEALGDSASALLPISVRLDRVRPLVQFDFVVERAEHLGDSLAFARRRQNNRKLRKVAEI